VQQPPDQRAWVEVDQFLLPGDQLDPPFVLAPGSMLREQARPVLGEGVDLQAALVRLPGPTDLVGLVGKYLRHRTFALPDQPWVPLRADDAELVDVAWPGGEAPISEVEPEEIRIRG
jgi:hypothetical protein